MVASPTGEMVPPVSPLNKKEQNGTQETNIRAIKLVVVVVIQIEFTSGLLRQFKEKVHFLICLNAHTMSKVQLKVTTT